MALEYNKTDIDSRISFKVRVALKGVREIEDHLKDIKVGTVNGVVHLMGKVPSELVKEAVGKAVINEVGDARSVVDELQVSK